MYSVLDATPARGKDFSRAVRDILERESTWVEWKKGGKGFGEHQGARALVELVWLPEGKGR